MLESRKTLFVAAVVVVALTVYGSAGASFPSPAGRAQQAASGAEVYQVNCEPCHGSEGKGDGPAARFLEAMPRDLTAGGWMYVDEMTVDAVFELVRDGITGTEMEPFEELLYEEEMQAVAEFVIAEFVDAQ